MSDVFEAIWKNKIVTGEEKPEKPNLIAFRNSGLAIKMLHKHIKNKSKMAIHCDVDVDGIGSGYIMGRFITNRTGDLPLYIINKDKIHGIQQKHVDYFKNSDLQLMIIVDSSSNDIDIIKQFKCDVLIIDHHEIDHDELVGNTAGDNTKYVIVNNTVDNSDIESIKSQISKINGDTAKKIEYIAADDRMSCGLVIYELLRLYCDTFNLGNLLENMMLFQWVGVTLFTDSILLNTPRNQWYIENTVHSQDTEGTLKVLLSELNRFKTSLDKTLINYTIAPVINKAIRAGHSGDALDTVIFNPRNISNLLKYREAQDNAIEIGIKDFKAKDSYILRDMSGTSVHKNYSGVIASRLCGEHNKNCVVYRVIDGIAEGSFRGRVPHIDYRKLINDSGFGALAQGHKAAFGIKCPVDKLDEVMEILTSIESESSGKYTLTAGSINNKSPGEFVIEDMEEFKRQGGIWKLGIGNSKLNNDEQLMITVSSSDAVLFEQRGKLYLYDIIGLRCKAFEPITKPIINIYVEYSKQIECYVK